MAIVDIKHTQTIEEAFGQVAEGGSGGGSGVFKVTFTYDETTYVTTVDKTYDEISAALASGALVYGVDERGTYNVAPVYDRTTHQPYGFAFTSIGISVRNGQQDTSYCSMIGYIVKTDNTLEDVMNNISMNK